MTRENFNRLPHKQKLLLVFTEGTYLAQRLATGYYADLFHLPGGYFVECFYHVVTRRLVAMRSLVPTYAYAPYLADIILPADLL